MFSDPRTRMARLRLDALPSMSDVSGAMPAGPINPYLRDAVLTASPEQLQLMLYDGAIRFASQGREALARRQYEETYEKLTRAQNIVLEMYKGLNFEVDKGLCQRIASLYFFVYNRLVEANVRRDPALIDDALRILRIERETWRMVVDKVSAARGGSGVGVAVAEPSAMISLEG